MWHYLKAAFWARPEIPGFGRLPLNVIVLSGLTLLGFGHEGFWLAAAAAETLYLYTLTTSERFRNVVDAENIVLQQGTVEEQRQALVTSLIPPRRQQLAALEKKCARILQLHHDNQSDEFTVESNAEALHKISWLYLKLLVAQQNIATLETPSDERDLQHQIDIIQADLSSAKISPSLKESKTATWKILQQRKENLSRRAQTMEEIQSDLTRIEAQVDLAMENTGMRGKTETISTNIDLVSQLLDDSVYGDSGASIAAIDETYALKA